MTETTKTVFDQYEIRKSKKQKSAFIDYVKSTAAAEGYECHTEKGYFGARNIVVGDPDTAKVIYTAHYDTCAVMPFPNFITPKNIGIYLLYQLLITAVLLGVPSLLVVGLYFLLSSIPGMATAVLLLLLDDLWLILLIAMLWFIMAGPPTSAPPTTTPQGSPPCWIS